MSGDGHTPADDDRLEALAKRIGELESRVSVLSEERARYHDLYLQTLAKCRTLEKGLLTTTRERLSHDQQQLTLDILGDLLNDASGGDEKSSDSSPDTSDPEDDEAGKGEPQPAVTVAQHKRRRVNGRRVLPESLPVITQEILPPEVVAEGTDAFELVGVEVTETLERRTSALYRSIIRRLKFVRKDRDRDRSEAARRERELAGESFTDFLVAEPPAQPIARTVAGPALLAHTVVARWVDHLPLHRQERIFEREGFKIARSTMCEWHQRLADAVRPLVDAMWHDARSSPVLAIDATGVLVQAIEKCRRAHFWVVIAPNRHALFGYTKNHKKRSVDELVGDYRGYLVADAHTVYDHLYVDLDITEVGCWAHARRYFFRAMDSEPEVAGVGLSLINRLFELERKWAGFGAKRRKRERRQHSAPVVEKFFTWAGLEILVALEDTPLARALTYATNQKEALLRFLEDGRLPIHNNASERALRRQAVGRKNWLFVGSDAGGRTNATMVSLLASCEMHEINPEEYLRDIFCLLPEWPSHRLLELAPLNWHKTRESEEATKRLEGNLHWRAAVIGTDPSRQIPVDGDDNAT